MRCKITVIFINISSSEIISINQKGQNKNVGFPTYLFCLFPTFLFYPLQVIPIMNKFIYKVLIKNNIILDEDVFYYGWSILKQYFIFFLITIPISIYCGIIFETLSFLAIYIPLRRYIGGFHFNRKYVCTIVSSIVTIFASFVSGKLQCNYMLITLTNLLLITATYLIAPVDHVNKRLSSREKDIYKKNL